MDKIIELAKKLLALSERGDDGEKDNAKQMLYAYLLKHNITIDDIKGVQRKDWLVQGIPKECRQIFINLVASIVGKNNQIWETQRATNFVVSFSDSEHIEFEDKWIQYKKAFKKEVAKLKFQQKKERKLLVDAFLHKHNLFSSSPSENSSAELTAEELEEIRQIIAMKNKMDNVDIFRKLNA